MSEQTIKGLANVLSGMSKKKKAAAVIGALALVALTIWLLLPSLVRREIKKRAAARGLHVEIGEVKVRPWRVELRDITVSADGIPVRPFRLDTITITMSKRLEVTEVQASGAAIEIDGEAGEVLEKLREKKGKGGPEAERAVKVQASGLSISWAGMCKDGGKAKAEGVTVSVDGAVSATADSVTATCRGVSLSAYGVKADRERITARSVDASYGLATVRAEEAAAGGKVKEPWVTAKTLTAAWNGASLTAADVRASAEAPFGKAKFGAQKLTLRHESLQSDITASEVEVTGATRDEGDWGWASMSVSAAKLSGTYAAVTGNTVTAGSLRVGGNVLWAAGFRKPWQVTGWKAVLGSAMATMDAEVREDGYTVSARLGDFEGDEVGCQDLLRAVPDGMAPKLSGFEAGGRVSASVKVVKSKSVSVKASLKNGCKFTKWPESMAPAALRKKFMRTAYGPGGQPVELESGPGSKGWTAYGRMSRFLTASIQATEDPGFFRHKGIDLSAVENSIQQDVEAGKFVRGASTVTMQLAKNLWLNRVKTVSRKVQEAFLTTYLEQVLTKEEILCLYFNVVEFGPGVYGIGPAADKFFKTTPEDLSLGQSLFLASVLPSPKTQWFGADGRIQEGRMRWLHGLMKSMRKADLLTDGELQDGLSEWLVFGKPSEKVPDTEVVVASPGGLSPDWSH